MADDHEDLFGDEEDAEEFFLPEHHAQNESEANRGELIDTLALPTPRESVTTNKASKTEDDSNSLASDGLDDDEELPEEEEATNPVEEINYQDLINQARTDAEKVAGDRGTDVHLPDLGELPAGASGASGAMVQWMAGVEQTKGQDGEPEEFSETDKALSRDEILREYYPGFRPNERLNFSDLFSVRTLPRMSRSSRKARSCVPSRVNLDVEYSGDNLMRAAAYKKRRLDPYGNKRIIETLNHDDTLSSQLQLQQRVPAASLDKSDLDLILACTSWDHIHEISSRDSAEEDRNTEAFVPGRTKLSFASQEKHIWSVDDLQIAVKTIACRVVLNMNDPHLLLQQSAMTPLPGSRSAEFQLPKRYNFSNDAAYDMLQGSQKSRERSTLTQLALEHAGFADRLQSPYYKTTLSKSEARAYHRPTATFKAGQELRFSRVRPRKKKDKDRSKDPKVLLATTKDISLSDNAGFVCLEYSEEYPAILSNVGMGSKILNYYRKRNEEDEYRPSEICGEPSILGLSDQSPFWNFGAVETGETVQAISNRMFRAPVFRHTPMRTDFLLVKSSTRLGHRFYLRNMKHLYTVGQTLPVIDIPGPHSRKVTTSYKNRLKMITYRLIRKSEFQSLQVKDLIKHFPDQTELQIRQRLKDFMEFQRRGGLDQNSWKLRTGDILPSEEATRAMIDPETVCLIDAMQVGQRLLEDSGYGKSADADDDQDDSMSVEQQLAPWIASRNFINATQGKAMLQLYGEGDPTGRGEGFSFIKTSMKGGFKVAGESVNDTLENEKPIPKGAHSYNVEKQRKAYEDEIARIWNAQKTTLGMTDEQVLDTEALENNNEIEGDSPFSMQSPGVTSELDDDLFSNNSGMSASNLNKVLKIERRRKDINGELVIETEVVTDPHVIHAYVLKRRALQEDAMDLDGDEGSANDEESRKRRKKKLEDQLLKLKRNAERRRLRKVQKDAGLIKSKSKKVRVDG